MPYFIKSSFQSIGPNILFDTFQEAKQAEKTLLQTFTCIETKVVYVSSNEQSEFERWLMDNDRPNKDVFKWTVLKN